jgi:predicted metal-dependent phosphoesterase TrpH
MKIYGLDGIAITDHDTLRGYFKLAQKKHGFLVIPGIELNTQQGHIIALNITQLVPSGLPLQESIEKIHNAGGIAVASHISGLKKGNVKVSLSNFDAVEVINSSAFPLIFSKWWNQKIAKAYSLPCTAGSDAHCASLLGSAYTSVNSADNVDDVIECIRKGKTKIFSRDVPWQVRIKNEALMLKKKFG